MRKSIFVICLIGLALLCTPTTVNAQAGKAVVKGIQAITKAASKNGGKAASKASKAGATVGAATVAKDAKAASKTGKYASEADKTKTARPVSYKCSKCNGSGKITTWNSYYGCYQNSTCSNCYGSGKITRVIRY